MSLRALWTRLVRRGRYERELDEELAFHLDAHAEALVQRGVERTEARRQARIALGMVELHKDAVRGAHGLARFDSWLGDSTHAVRSLRRSPAFALSAIAILGVSMSAYLLLMAIHHAYLGNPPATAAPGELFDLQLRTRQGDVVRLTRAEAESIRPGLAGLARDAALTRQADLALNTGAPATAYGIAANGGYFALLARKAELGRGLRAEDAVERAEPVVVLGHGGWRRFAGSDPAIVGKTLTLGGQPHRVVGVMPRGFAGFEAFPPHFWVEAAQYETWQRNADTAEGPLPYDLSLQLAPGASVEQARQRIEALVAALPQADDPDARVAQVELLPRTAQLSATETQGNGYTVLALVGLALVVLVVACANLANLMLARALARRQELSIRASVGASRWRLLRILMLESLMLALGGAALALLLAHAGADPLHRYTASLLTGLGFDVIAIEVDPWLALHALALALGACLLFGLPPALAVTGDDLAAGARRDARLFRNRLAPGRLRSLLVTAQISGSLVLLVVTALFMDGARRTERVAIGYDAHSLIDLRHERVDARLRQAIESVPGVAGTTAVARTPLYGRMRLIDSVVGERSVPLAYHAVDERYFEVFGLALDAGRGFDAAEAANRADVAVISARTAAELWPGQSALGRTIRVADPAPGAPAPRTLEVIGVVGDVVSGLATSGVDRSAVYLPRAMDERSSLIARVTERHDDAVLARVADACQAASRVPCDPWRLSRVAGMVLVPLAVASRLGVAIGGLALLLAAIGLYGVVRYQVGSRTREIGLRVALGATTSQVFMLVMRQALRQIGAGLAVGLVLCLIMSLALARVIGSEHAFPASAYTVVPLLLAAVALLASWLPARAAARVDATEALREG